MKRPASVRPPAAKKPAAAKVPTSAGRGRGEGKGRGKGRGRNGRKRKAENSPDEGDTGLATQHYSPEASEPESEKHNAEVTPAGKPKRKAKAKPKAKETFSKSKGQRTQGSFLFRCSTIRWRENKGNFWSTLARIQRAHENFLEFRAESLRGFC